MTEYKTSFLTLETVDEKTFLPHCPFNSLCITQSSSGDGLFRLVMEFDIFTFQRSRESVDGMRAATKCTTWRDCFANFRQVVVLDLLQGFALD